MNEPIDTNEIKLPNGLTLKLFWYYDDWGMTPWDQCEINDRHFDGKWEHRGSENKRPYERVIAEDRGSFIFYDFQSAVRNLKKQGCSGIEADRIANAEVKWMRDWCNEKWFYGTLVIECPDLPDFDSIAVGGYELPYAREEAEQNLLAEAKEQIEKIQINFKPNFYPLATA